MKGALVPAIGWLLCFPARQYPDHFVGCGEHTPLTACSLTPPGTTSPVAGLTGSDPEQKTKPFAAIACAKGNEQGEEGMQLLVEVG
jgi:hypothetical protein